MRLVHVYCINANLTANDNTFFLFWCSTTVPNAVYVKLYYLYLYNSEFQCYIYFSWVEMILKYFDILVFFLHGICQHHHLMHVSPAIGPILDGDRLKDKILKPWKGVLCIHFCVCESVCGLQRTPFDLGT